MPPMVAASSAMPAISASCANEIPANAVDNLLLRRLEIGRRDQHAEALAPDDHARIILEIDAGRYGVALAALECTQPPEVDIHHAGHVGARANVCFRHQINMKRGPRSDLEVGFQKHRALV